MVFFIECRNGHLCKNRCLSMYLLSLVFLNLSFFCIGSHDFIHWYIPLVQNMTAFFIANMSGSVSTVCTPLYYISLLLLFSSKMQIVARYSTIMVVSRGRGKPSGVALFVISPLIIYVIVHCLGNICCYAIAHCGHIMAIYRNECLTFALPILPMCLVMQSRFHHHIGVVTRLTSSM